MDDMTKKILSPVLASMRKEISDALAWFKSNNIEAYTHDGSIYVEIGEVSVMVSDAEVSYRADLYRSENTSDE